MRFPYAQVCYFHDGIVPPSVGKRGQTVQLARTGGPVEVTNAWQEIADRCEAVPGLGPVTNQWVIHSVTVNQTRVWACSMAKITLTRPYHGEPIIELPPFHPEMPISLEYGYAPSLYAEVTPDMVLTEATGGDWDDIRRRFMGYVDTLNVKVSNRRIICTIVARDKIRFLIDNRLVGFFDPNRLVQAQNVTFTSDMNAKEATADQKLPVTLQNYYDEIRAGVGEDSPLDLANGMARQVIVKALIEYGSGSGISKDDLSQPGNDYGNIDGFNAGRLDANAQVRAAIATDTNDFGQLSNSFTVMNKAPIEPLKRLSTLEDKLPKELYADQNGRVYWRRRVASRATDPHKFYVTDNPNPMDVRHAVTSCTSEFSTVGTINGLIVVNPMYATGGSDPVVAASAALDPMKAFGFFMHPRFRYLFDETLGTGAPAEALVRPVIDAQFLIWGKDIRGIDLEVFGHPDVFVGDAVQAINAPYFCFPVDDPRTTLRVDALVDSLLAEGSKRGYRTRILLTVALTEESSVKMEEMYNYNGFQMPVTTNLDTTNAHEARNK